MRRLPLVLLALAVPAIAQEPAPDGGTLPAVVAAADAGTPQPQPERVGRHFAFTWDSQGPAAGTADVQAWFTPRWGRPDGLFAVDVRAGFVQGLPRDWAAGIFLDATPSSTGVQQTPGIDGRVTLHLQNRGTLGRYVSYGSQAELGAGLHGFSLALLVAADAQLGPLRLAVNLDGYTETPWQRADEPEFGTARLRQTVGFSYTLSNGFSAGLELQNRLTWTKGAWSGDALLVGPSVAYRGSRFWWAVALLPQVAAIKAEAQRALADPLELTANERFTLRLSAGLNAR
jgi:hypothetical protein